MRVDPNQPGRPQRTDAGRTDAAQTRKITPQPTPVESRPVAGTGAPTDSVELSPEARALAESLQNAEKPPVGAISPEKLAQVSERLKSGHYDRPEVKDAVLRNLTDDLDAS